MENVHVSKDVLHYEIAPQIPLKDLNRLCRTQKKWARVCRDPEMWRKRPMEERVEGLKSAMEIRDEDMVEVFRKSGACDALSHNNCTIGYRKECIWVKRKGKAGKCQGRKKRSHSQRGGKDECFLPTRNEINEIKTLIPFSRIQSQTGGGYTLKQKGAAHVCAIITVGVLAGLSVTAIGWAISYAGLTDKLEGAKQMLQSVINLCATPEQVALREYAHAEHEYMSCSQQMAMIERMIRSIRLQITKWTQMGYFAVTGSIGLGSVVGGYNRLVEFYLKIFSGEECIAPGAAAPPTPVPAQPPARQPRGYYTDNASNRQKGRVGQPYYG